MDKQDGMDLAVRTAQRTLSKSLEANDRHQDLNLEAARYLARCLVDQEENDRFMDCLAQEAAKDPEIVAYCKRVVDEHSSGV